jgi:glycosyltransferase involved in cell wall biosynthesis
MFLPDFSAGTEVLTYSTAKELQRCGHEVRVFTGYPAPRGLADSHRFDNYEYDGIPVSRFRHAAEPMGGQSNIVEAEYNNLFFASRFREYLKKFEPDLVHFFHLKFLSASAVDVCEDLGIPMIFTPTDFWFICPTYQLRFPGNAMCNGPDQRGVNCLRHAAANTQSRRLTGIVQILPDWTLAATIWAISKGAFSGYWAAPFVHALSLRADFLKKRMNKLDRVIVPTHLMNEMLVKNGLHPSKVVFSRFGINTSVSTIGRNKQGAISKLRVGFIGSLSEHKGVHILISAFRSLPANTSAELKIYGKGDDPGYIEKLRQLAGDDQRIKFCGTFPNGMISNILDELDVLVVPSIWYENTPLVIYSAQTAGRPVIATNLAGMAEVVHHGKNGLLFESGNIAGLASAIQRLMQEPGLLGQLAANAVKPKSISEYVTELQNIYDDVLRERGNGI